MDNNPESISLARVVAAERNARSALSVIERLEKVNVELVERMSKIEQTNAQLQQQLSLMNVKVHTSGTIGSTA